jgi:hypothetical protein
MSNVHAPGSAPERNHKRKRWIVLGFLGIFALAGGAYAYFTTSGSGTGSTRVGTSTALTINATITPGSGGIVPDGNPAAIAFSAVNTGTSAQLVDTIHLESVDAYTDAGHTTPAAGCDTSDFSGADVVAHPPGPAATTAITAPGSLVFADSGTNQDACKLAYLVLTFSSN